MSGGSMGGEFGLKPLADDGNDFHWKIEKMTEGKSTSVATKEDIERVSKEIERGFKEQNQSRLNAFIVTVIMILGLYAAIFFRK